MRRRRLGWPTLDQVGAVYGMERVGILEWTPVLGTIFFRRRIEAAIAKRMGVRVAFLFEDDGVPDHRVVLYHHPGQASKPSSSSTSATPSSSSSSS